MEIGTKKIKQWKKICKNCGHNHVNLVGDGGRNKDEVRWELMDECCYCNCEKFGGEE